MHLKRINGNVIAEGDDLRLLVENNKYNLIGAYLSEAYLSGADLSVANLSEANLRVADLSGANRTDYKLKNTPFQILGLKWNVIIFDQHMEIGCEKHSFEDWRRLKDSRIEKMDSDALKFWNENKALLLGLCDKMEEK